MKKTSKEEEKEYAKKALEMISRSKACCRNCKHPVCPNRGKTIQHYCGNYR